MPQIEHVALFADDLEALRTFYEQAFGLRVVVDNSRAPVAGYFLAGDGGSALELIARPAGQANTNQRYVCHVAFLVDDHDAARSDLEARGVRFEEDTAVRTEEFRTSFFRDPQGNRAQIVWRARPLGS